MNPADLETVAAANVDFIAWGVVVSFSTALVFTALGAFLGRSGESTSGPRWGAAVGVGLGYIFGHAAMSEWHSGDRPADTWRDLQTWTREGGAFPLFAGNGWDWLPWIAAIATLVGVLDGAWPAPRWSRWQNRLLLVVLLMWLVFSPLVGGLWMPGQGAAWMIGLGAATFALATVLDIRAARLGPSMPLVLMVPAIGMAAAQHFSESSYVFAILSGALAATTGALWVVSWFSPRMNLARATIPTYAMVYAGLAFGGMFYGGLPRTSALALALAPLASFIDRVGPWQMIARPAKLDDAWSDEGVPGGGWKASTARVVAMLVPIGIAVGAALVSGSM